LCSTRPSRWGAAIAIWATHVPTGMRGAARSRSARHRKKSGTAKRATSRAARVLSHAGGPAPTHSRYFFSPTHPCLPYVAPHFSHIPPFILVFYPFELAGGACLIGPCAHELADERAWWAEWSARLSCWWVQTPYQGPLQACFGALGLSLAQRFEQLVRLKGANIPRGPFEGTSEPGCDWVSDGSAQLELPEFPAIGDGFEFTLPPIPRLLPSFQHLQSYAPGVTSADAFGQQPSEDTIERPNREVSAAAASAAAATSVPVDAIYYAGLGASAGFLLGVILARLRAHRRACKAHAAQRNRAGVHLESA